MSRITFGRGFKWLFPAVMVLGIVLLAAPVKVYATGFDAIGITEDSPNENRTIVNDPGTAETETVPYGRFAVRVIFNVR